MLLCLHKLEIVTSENYADHLEFFVLNPDDICVFPVFS
jgi:hypothetical protein